MSLYTLVLKQKLAHCAKQSSVLAFASTYPLIVHIPGCTQVKVQDSALIQDARKHAVLTQSIAQVHGNDLAALNTCCDGQLN